MLSVKAKRTFWISTLFIIFASSSYLLYPLVFPRDRYSQKEEEGPSDWMSMQRAFPYGKINQEAYLNAVEQTRAMRKKKAVRSNPWVFAGPDNIGGRITDIESPPGHPEILYVGGATGGILKSTNGGSTWTNLFHDLPVITVGDIAIDPVHPDTIWCGTGEANSSSFSFLGTGIYRSTDAGDSWQQMGLTHSAYIGRVIVDYSNTNRIFAAALGNLFTTSDERGVYRSNDGGQTWDRVLYLTDSTSAVDLVQHPTNPQILYATMWERCRGLVYRRSFGQSSGIWKSTDGGTTWNELLNGLPKGDQVGRIGIDISKTDPNILYAFYDMDNYEVGVYKSTNGGNSWTRTNDGPLQGMSSNFGWYFGQIRIDPTNNNRVYVGMVSLYRTEDGGDTWTDITGWGSIHVDNHAFFFQPNNTLLEGNDGGLYSTTDHGDTWTKINNLPLTQFYAIDIDYLHPERIYGGTQDNNSIRTYTGSTSDWEPLLGGDGMYCLVDYTNSDIIFCEYQYGKLYRSDDGGFSMNYLATPMENDRVNWSAPLAMHPLDPSILYFGTYRVWKTTDHGNNWLDISGDLTHGGDTYFYTLTTLDVSPVNPSLVLAGSGDGKVQISVDDGQSWQDVSAGLPERWVTQVKADPFDAQTFYVTLSGFRWDEPLPHVFKTTDLGQHWTDISGNLPEFPVNSIAVDPDVPGRLIVGTDAGLYGTADGGQTWMWMWDELPAVPICALKVHKPTRTIVAGTYGLSCYKSSLDDLFTGINIPGQQDKIALSAFPNPLADQTTLKFYLPEADHLTITLYTLQGGRIRQLFDGKLAKGKQSIRCGLTGQGTQIPAGIYLVGVRGSHTSGSLKIMKL